MLKSLIPLALIATPAHAQTAAEVSATATEAQTAFEAALVNRYKRDLFAEMKAVGYDTKIARQLIRLRKLTPDDRATQDALLETYRCALGIG